MKQLVRWQRWLGLLMVAMFLLVQGTDAQATPSAWAPPQPINQECCAAYPVPIVDPWGQLHLFWADADGYIWYAKRTGETWSQPLEVIANPGNSSAAGPDVAVDQTGKFHLIWRDGGAGGALYYSSADAQQAGNARAWRSPIELAPQALGAAIAVGPEGVVVVAYTPFQAGESFAIITTEDGNNWSEPVLALSRLSAGFTGGSYVNLAIDAAGGLHVAWNSQVYPGGYPEHAVFYQKSLDGGLTWSDPYDPDPLPAEVAANANSNFKNKMLNVAVGPDGDVHLTWHQYTGSRFHRWSGDGGVTWSEQEPVFPDMGAAYNGVVDMAFDSGGRMHVVASRGAIWYRTWSREGGWTPPELVDATSADWHHHRVAVVGGNQVYLFYPDINETGILWYIHKTVDAPPTVPLPTPTLGVISAAPPSVAAAPDPIPSSTPTVNAVPLADAARQAPPTRGDQVVWICAVAPALLLVGAVLVGHLMGNRRR